MAEFLNKITSRKFLISVAAFLASLGTGIAGIAGGNEIIATTGIACTVLSGAIYAGCEAAVDSARLKANSTTTTLSANATTDATIKKVIAATGVTTEEK